MACHKSLIPLDKAPSETPSHGTKATKPAPKKTRTRVTTRTRTQVPFTCGRFEQNGHSQRPGLSLQGQEIGDFQHHTNLCQWIWMCGGISVRTACSLLSLSAYTYHERNTKKMCHGPAFYATTSASAKEGAKEQPKATRRRRATDTFCTRCVCIFHSAAVCVCKRKGDFTRLCL